MKRKAKTAPLGRLLLGAAMAVPALAITAFPARAFEAGWSTEITNALAERPAAPAGRLTPAAAARAAARERARAAAQKTEAPDTEAQKPKTQKAQDRLTEPSAEEAAEASAAGGGAAGKAEPMMSAIEIARASSAALAARSEEDVSAAAAGMAVAAADKPDGAAADESEPDDPFADLRLVKRPGDDSLTTQVTPESRAPNLVALGPANDSAAAQYCNNIADAAIDARIAWQRQNLAEAEKELARRTAELEAKTAEFQKWLARRNDFAEKAKKVVVDIYTKMKPDAAAAQLQALDEETAAAVLIKLDARSASAVMNEMDPVQAARLTGIISGAGKLPRKPRAGAPQGNAS